MESVPSHRECLADSEKASQKGDVKQGVSGHMMEISRYEGSDSNRVKETYMVRGDYERACLWNVFRASYPDAE